MFVTHEQAEVRRAADWVVVIDGAAGGQRNAGRGPRSTGPAGLDQFRRAGQPLETGPGGPDSPGVVSVGGQALVLPPHGTIVPAFVEFSPSNVILSRQDVKGLSARNHLRGRVRRIVPVNQAVFVAVDVGQIVWAEVTPQAVVELELSPGCEVVCLFKTHSLRVIAR